jgi:hypothetical protein
MAEIAVHETDLALEPNEASDLCPLPVPSLLADRGWDRAFVTVLDEVPAEQAIAVLGHDADAEPGEGWHAIRVPCVPQADAGRTEDAESCAWYDGWVYVLGSQFGAKDGPLEAKRSWAARVRGEDLAAACVEGADPVPLELVRLRFSLHRAINDALAGAALELIERGPLTTERYIDATIALGAAKNKRWAGRVTASDHPINIEGADFRSDGRLLIGLRYPVTADGHPILVELTDPAALFGDPDAIPNTGNVWTLEDVGSPEAPSGLRALHAEGNDRFDAIAGDLDAAKRGATILADHDKGTLAESVHVRFELPLAAAGGALTGRRLHEFGDVRRVEGVALAPDGHAHYVIDEEGHVGLRTLLLETDED